MEETFVLDGMDDWLLGLDQTYEDGMAIGLEEFFRKLHAVIMRHTPMDNYTAQGKTKSTGEHIKANWELDIADNRMGALISNDFDYGPDLEYGLYPNVGPRTTSGPGGIFSKQAPQGIIGPIIKDKERLQGYLDEVISALESHIDSLTSMK